MTQLSIDISKLPKMKFSNHVTTPALVDEDIPEFVEV
jgi:hypothetical protein